ncbi:hypothetical protein V8F06_004160 [Rhypophila decipiens]
MLQSQLLATGGVFLGLLGSAVHAQLSTTEDKVNVLLPGLSKPTATSEPTVTVLGAVLEALPTRTVYYIFCADSPGGSGADADPCSVIGGTVTQEPTRWEYDVAKATQAVSVWNPGPGNGTKTTTYVEKTTTGTIICNVASNTASCEGTLTYRHTTNGEEDTVGKRVYNTAITDVDKNLFPVTITSGYSKVETSTTTTSTTSSSTGAAAALVTQPAGGLLFGVAGAAAVVVGALVL